MIPPVTALWQPARFKLGHNTRVLESTRRYICTKGRTPWNKGKSHPSAIGNTYGKVLKGRWLKTTDESRAEIAKLCSQSGMTNKEIADKFDVCTVTVNRIMNEFGVRRPNNGQFNSGFTPWNKGLCGPDSIGWKGGASTLPYGPEFTRSLKKKIRNRDGHTCQNCGKTKEEHWRTLEVHHIDHDKFNNHPSNLITLCSSCNQYFSWHREESLQITGE